MAEAVRTDGICLRVMDFSESSQIVTMLADRYGLVGLIAKGIRKIPKKTSSPLMAPLDVLTTGQVVFIPARQAGHLGVLTAWDVTDHRPNLRRHYQKILMSQVLAEVTMAMGASDDAPGDVLRQLDRTISDLTVNDSLRPFVAYLKYAAAAAGYAPDLISCTGCKTPLHSHASMMRSAVGLFCDDCCGTDVAIRINRRILVALDRLPPPSDLPNPQLQPPSDPAALIQAAQLLLLHLRATLEDRLRLVEPFLHLFQPAVPANRPALPPAYQEVTLP
ncbi:MAG: DNA repair protein RecO [Phycisphaerae bacterium]